MKPLWRYSAGTISSAPSTVKYLEITGWRVDLAADVERDLDGVGDEPVALELHLPARDVEARDQLLVRARSRRG